MVTFEPQLNVTGTGYLTIKDMDQEDCSPLKRFVLAKKKIGEVFEQLLNYVQEGSQFVKGGMKCITYFFFIPYFFCKIFDF